jgi:hypothetical protein
MAYLPLSTANLPDPAIDPAQESSPADYFGSVVWSGNSSATKRTDIQFDGVQPDLVWLKNRTLSRDHALHDDVRGLNARIKSNNTEAESTSDAPFDTDGFGFNGVDTQLRIATTNSSYNASGSSYVAWGWKASGASGVANNVGSIPSTVSANTESGFSIVSYTGDTTTTPATVGHGLSQKPEMILFKRRTGSSTADWNVYHQAIGATGRLKLNLTDASQTTSTSFNDTEPTNTEFTVNTATQVNPDGDDVIAYCFHSVDGFSKLGSYTGNGSTDGPFVYTGFRPAFVMIKCSSAASTMWIMFDAERDTYNVVDTYLQAQATNAEASFPFMDYVSNGFKHRHNSSHTNTSGQTYIYMAFAENPFKYSNAR